MTNHEKLPVDRLQPRVHEIRRPGEATWLPVEEVDRRPDGSVFLRAGGRIFTTTVRTPWPAREVAA